MSYLQKRNEHRNKNKKKQGRNLETRKLVIYNRQKIEKSNNTYNLRERKNNFHFCSKCHGHMVEDEHGFLFCENCGKVNENVMSENRLQYFNPFETSISFYPVKTSVKYKEEVHLRTKLNMASGMGPYIDITDIDQIENYLRKNPQIFGGNLYLIGPNSIRKSIASLKLPTRYKACWVQIRSHFQIPFVGEDVFKVDFATRDRLIKRYNCVTKAFHALFKNKTNKINFKKRKNMPVLHYSIIQLIRLESESLFRETARFFPLSWSSKNNNNENNNKIWKQLIKYCDTHFRLIEVDNCCYSFDWPYKKLTLNDILCYFMIYK